MDNIEEIIDADVREKAVEDMAAYKVGDVVWIIPEKRFGIVEDRSLAKDADKVLYRVRIAPELGIYGISEKLLSRPLIFVDRLLLPVMRFSISK